MFVEQIVRRRLGKTDYLIIGGAVFAGILAVLLSMWFLPPFFAAAVLLAACVGAWLLIRSRNCEFEYSVTGGELTCDKIINRSRRVRQFSVAAAEFAELGPCAPEKLRGRTFAVVRTVSRGERGGPGDWYFTGPFAREGMLLAVFSPSDRVLDALKPYLKRQVKEDAFGGH